MPLGATWCVARIQPRRCPLNGLRVLLALTSGVQTPDDSPRGADIAEQLEPYQCRDRVDPGPEILPPPAAESHANDLADARTRCRDPERGFDITIVPPAVHKRVGALPPRQRMLTHTQSPLIPTGYSIVLMSDSERAARTAGPCCTRLRIAAGREHRSGFPRPAEARWPARIESRSTRPAFDPPAGQRLLQEPAIHGGT